MLDSLGEHEGFSRLCHSLGLPPMHPVMSLWAATKDKRDKCTHDYRKRIEAKRRRAAGEVSKMKEGMKKSVRAKETGVTHEMSCAVASFAVDDVGTAMSASTESPREGTREGAMSDESG